jgi:hypothetical protein
MVPAGKLLPPGQDQGQVIAPCRRVFTGSKAVGFCVIKHRLNPSAKARSCFWNPVPNRLEDRKNRRRVYRIDRLIENRPAIIIDRLRHCAAWISLRHSRRLDFMSSSAHWPNVLRAAVASWAAFFASSGSNALGEHGTVAEGQRAEARLSRH